MDQTLNARLQKMQETLRRRLGRLTEEQATQLQEAVEDFIGQLQEKYGYSRDEAGEVARDLFEQYTKPIRQTVQDHLPEVEIRPSPARRRQRRASWMRRFLVFLAFSAALYFLRRIQGVGQSQPGMN